MGGGRWRDTVFALQIASGILVFKLDFSYTRSVSFVSKC
jgi:hypothetical protein